MDYKKEYEEMVQRVKELHEAGNDLTKNQMEIICPALAESEDERIRKELIEQVGYILPDKEEYDDEGNVLPTYHKRIERYRAYLEKQKEQKHPDGCFTCNEYKKGYEEGRRNGFTAGYNKAIKEVEQKEQKPVDFPTTDEEVNDFLETHPKVEVPEKYKTSDFVFSKQEYESYPIISKDTTSVKLAEWSEDIIQKAVKEIGLTQHQIDWFKTNVFPPKQEWSEEDDEMVEEIKHIVFGAGSVKNGMREKIHNWLYNRLKYLCPAKQEWSAEDKKNFYWISTRIQQANMTPEYSKKVYAVLDWLKSLLPQSK